jgi:hypothetical protein
LHATRWQDGRKVTYTARLGDLPNGTMVAAPEDDTPYLLWQERLWRWDFSGYTPGAQWQPSTAVRVLTPKPIVEILAAGYPVQLHPSLFESVRLESGLPLE